MIHDNRIDGWTSSAGAISYSLRGPVMVFDNEFTNGPSGGGPPIQPRPPLSANHTFWVLANNQLEGKPAGGAALLKAPANVKVYDIDATAKSTPTVPRSPLSPKTVFLKSQWPTPTRIFDATSFGANGSDTADDTLGIQAAIDAAAKAGGGAMAYLPAGAYRINKTLEISGTDFWFGGSGLMSSITYTCPKHVVAVGRQPELGGGAGPHWGCNATTRMCEVTNSGNMTQRQCMIACCLDTYVCMPTSGPNNTCVPSRAVGDCTLPSVPKAACEAAAHTPGSPLCIHKRPGPPPPRGMALLCPEAAGPALRVSAATNVSIEMMLIKAPSFTDQLLIQGGTGIHQLKLDGIYAVNSATNTEKWNGTTTIHVASLMKGETVHAVHLDGNLNVSGSEAGTVLVGMIIQSTLHVNNAAGRGATTAEASATAVVPRSRAPTDGPPLGILTFIGLIDDYDVVVRDDSSVVIEDLYCEQLKVGHLLLSGSSSLANKPSSDSSSGTGPGRVVIQGVKVAVTSPAVATIDNYHGSLFYMSGMFMDKNDRWVNPSEPNQKGFTKWLFAQTGSAEFNLTLLGNDFDTQTPEYLRVSMGEGGKKGSLNLLANLASNFSNLDCGESFPPLADQVEDPSMWLVHQALDDFRRLGSIDLQLNHPAVWRSLEEARGGE